MQKTVRFSGRFTILFAIGVLVAVFLTIDFFSEDGSWIWKKAGAIPDWLASGALIFGLVIGAGCMGCAWVLEEGGTSGRCCGRKQHSTTITVVLCTAGVARVSLVAVPIFLIVLIVEQGLIMDESRGYWGLFAEAALILVILVDLAIACFDFRLAAAPPYSEPPTFTSSRPPRPSSAGGASSRCTPPSAAYGYGSSMNSEPQESGVACSV